MAKRILSLVLVVAMALGIVLVADSTVHASDNMPMIDGSYLTHEDESIGYDTKITRGQYLLTGYSKGVRLGAGSYYAGGSTIATETVEEVGVSVVVERAQKEDEAWTVVAGWEKFNENADRVSSNQRMTVDGGYYYRVRCIHVANNDVSTSFTDGVFVEEPSIFD